MKTISQQTGWNRPYPLMICQEHDVLLTITEFSFDMADQDFLSYFRSRTGLQVGKEDNPAQSTFLLTSPDAEKWLLESPEYRYQQSGRTVPFGKEREQAVKVKRIIKGRLYRIAGSFTLQKMLAPPFKTFQNESRHSSTCSHDARLKTIIK